MNIRIRMAQLNFKIADFDNNAAKIVQAINDSRDTDLIVFSELSLSGYAPMDLVFEPWFFPRQDKAFNQVLETSIYFDGVIAIGYVRQLDQPGKKLANSLAIISKGKVIGTYDKQLLPTYDVFDERRYFEPGSETSIVVNIKDTMVGFIICEDGWNSDGQAYALNPVNLAVEHGAQVIVSLNASPSNLGKQETRRAMFTDISNRYKVPLVYVNQIGGNDQVVYEGASFAIANGRFYQAKSFQELTAFVHIQNGVITNKELLFDAPSFKSDAEFQLQQIKLGLKDYLKKTGFKKVLVGSSGGIDSAVTIALAVEALGAENVEAVTMPSRYSSTGSVSHSEQLCNNLGVTLRCHPIKSLVAMACNEFSDAFNAEADGVALENLQARIRGMVLMTRSNQSGAMLLTTGNKSELSVGYATLYGDMSGGLNLIGDLYKTEVFALAEYINERAGRELIPSIIITKPPSAELAIGQQDSDSLPPYPVLDSMLMTLIERENLPEQSVKFIESVFGNMDSFEIEALRNRVASMLAKAEFKRRQAPPVIRCRSLAFGSGRQMPIACVGS